MTGHNSQRAKGKGESMESKPFSINRLNGDADQVQADLDILQDEMRALKSIFAQRYPSSPIYLCKNPDSANGGLRWRYSRFHSEKGARLELNQVLNLMKGLPKSIQDDWLGFESERIRLNFEVTPLL